MPRGAARKKAAPTTATAVPLLVELEPSQPVSDVSSDGATSVDEQVDVQEEEEVEVEQALPQPDMLAPAPVPALDTTTVAALSQQLQMMQQIIMMQQQQLQQQQEQFKTELENTKRFILTSQASAATAHITTPTPAAEVATPEQQFTPFRATVPSLPQQVRPGRSVSSVAPQPANTAAPQAGRTNIENMRLQQRLGLVDDTIVRTAVNPVISPLAEFKLGSTYVTEAGLM